MRRVTSFVLATVASIVIVVGVVAVSAVHALFTRSTVEHTVTKVVADPSVDQLLSREITKKAVTAVGEPALQAPLQQRVTALVASPTVQADVITAAMVTYDLLVKAGKTPITFNLPRHAQQVRSEVAVLAPALVAKLPPANTMLQFKLFDRSKVPAVYRAIQRIKHVVWWVLLGGIVVLAFAAVLGKSRRVLLTWAAGTITVLLIVASVALQAISNRVVKGLKDPVVRQVTRVATDSFLADIRHYSNVVIVIAAVGLLAGIAATVARRVLGRRRYA
jgi:hypothetical protein